MDEAEGRRMWMIGPPGRAFAIVPEAFDHLANGYVGLLVMRRFL
jgi:hypothetical protein